MRIIVCVMDGSLTDSLNALFQSRYASLNEHLMTKCTLHFIEYELKPGVAWSQWCHNGASIFCGYEVGLANRVYGVHQA